MVQRDNGAGVAGETRRDFIKTTAGALAVAGGLDALAGWGDSIASAASTASGRPKKGGTLRAAFSSGSATDTLDGDNVTSYMDFARNYQLYDSLYAFDANGIPQPQLAEEAIPNKDATVWTFRLRPGVTWHNGKELDAEDVVFTFQRIVAPKHPLGPAPFLAAMDVKNLKAVDKHTVRIPFHVPFSSFVGILPTYTFFIVPKGFDPKHPVGTGPWKFKSFTPGQQSTFVRNENYWDGPPYLDTLIITDFADEGSQINALLSGQADVIDLLSASGMKSVTSGGGRVQVGKGGSIVPFSMRADVAPFNDVRVRQAMRLIVDRPQMLDLVYGGHGIIGNDIFSYFDPFYDHGLPQRRQDIAQAKSLLKRAGHENLTTTLVTGPIGQGAVQAAQVLAQQAKAAGVTINIQQLTTTAFYGPNYLKWVFLNDSWGYYPFFPMVAASSVKVAPYNETHFNDSAFNRLYAAAQATTDRAKQAELAREMQMIYYDRGPYIIPFFSPTIDGFAKNVMGITSGKTGVPFNDFNFKKVWLA
jgi:peptide/nickel transport system substrate-binding protein